MKRRRALAPADSLDLLLDTMCNTFGGIILIALLVALMPQKKPDGDTPSPSATLYEQRIAFAEAELAALQKHVKNTPTDDTTAATVELAGARDRLTNARKDALLLASDVTQKAASIATLGGAAWEQLAEEFKKLERRETELRNLIAATEAETTRLQERRAALEAQARDEQSKQTVKLRFPKERPRTRNSLAVICRFGRIYPIYQSGGVKDRTNITWKSVGGESEESIPLAEKGVQFPKDSAAFRALLTAFKAEDVYIAFYVYPESYEAFRAAKDAAIEARYEFGIEVVPGGRRLLWGPNGSSPPPL